MALSFGLDAVLKIGERFGLSFGAEKCPTMLGIIHNGSTEGVDVLPVLVRQNWFLKQLHNFLKAAQ